MRYVRFRRAIVHAWSLVAWSIVAVAPTQVHATPVPQLVDAGHPIRSDNGAAQLRWSSDAAHFQVRLRGDAVPDRIVHEGRMPSAHLSGLADGTYAVRVRAEQDGVWSPWSAPRRIVVEHMSLSLVWVLMGFGAITFGATAAVVLTQARREAA